MMYYRIAIFTMIALSTSANAKQESIAWANIEKRFSKGALSWLGKEPQIAKESSKQVQQRTSTFANSNTGIESTLLRLSPQAMREGGQKRDDMLELAIALFYAKSRGIKTQWSVIDKTFAFWEKLLQLDVIELRWVLYLACKCYSQPWQIAYLKKLRRHFPDNPMHDLQIVKLCHLDRKEWNFAKEISRKLEEKYGYSATVNGNIGLFFYRLGKRDQRKEYILESIRLFKKGIESEHCLEDYRETLKIHLKQAEERLKSY